MEKDLETTFYRFLSEVRSFLSKLVSDPIKAQPSKYLKDRDFEKSKLIRVLIGKDILERHEKILDSTNSDEKKAKYVVKYKVKKKDFEKRVRRIYIKYFEKNEPDEEKGALKECEGGDAGGGFDAGMGGDLGGTSSFSVGASTTRGDMGFDVAFPDLMRRKVGTKRKKKDPKPGNILGKTITAESKGRNIFITEEQLNIIRRRKNV